MFSFRRSAAALAAVTLVGALAAALPASATLTNSFYGTLYAPGFGTPQFQANSLSVKDTSAITASVTWDDTAAKVTILIKNSAGVQVANAMPQSGGSETLNYTPPTVGTYSVSVGVSAAGTNPQGIVNYALTVTHSASVNPPASLASYVNMFGYPGAAGLYAYGMAWDPTDNSVLTSDYWNYREQRFTAAGAPVAILADKTPAAPQTGAGYGLAVDATDIPTTGPNAGLSNFWVAQQEQARVVEFDHSGNWLETVGLGGNNFTYAKGCGGGKMTFPTHIAVDSTPGPYYGDLYISDVACKNSVDVFSHAGQFLFSFNWSGYQAADKINQATPRGIEFGANGNVYVAELNGKSVVEFTPSGAYVGFIALPDAYNQGSYGSGLDDVRGIAVDNPNNLLYMVAAEYGCVFQINQDTSADTWATNHTATLVHKWCTIDGTKTGPAFDSIRYIAADNSGNVYVGDTWGNPDPTLYPNGDPGFRIYKFAPGTTSAQPVTPQPWASGSEPPPNGGFNNNNGVAVVTDSNGNSSLGSVFVTDDFGQQVEKFAPGSTCLSPGDCPSWQYSFGSRATGGTNSPGFDYPKAIAYGDGVIWVGDQDGNAIVAYNPDTGTFINRFGSHGKAPGQFSGGVQGISVENGNVYAVDTGNCRLSVFTETQVLTTQTPVPVAYMGSCGTGAGQMSAPRGLAVTPDGNTAYVVNTNNGVISIWQNLTSGTPTETNVTPVCGGTKLKLAVGDALDPSGTWLYVADTGNARLVRMNLTGTVCQVVSTGYGVPNGGAFKGPQYIAFDASGNIYISDRSRYIYEMQITG